MQDFANILAKVLLHPRIFKSVSINILRPRLLLYERLSMQVT